MFPKKHLLNYHINKIVKIKLTCMSTAGLCSASTAIFWTIKLLFSKLDRNQHEIHYYLCLTFYQAYSVVRPACGAMYLLGIYSQQNQFHFCAYIIQVMLIYDFLARPFNILGASKCLWGLRFLMVFSFDEHIFFVF